jgi:hypothetical protein
MKSLTLNKKREKEKKVLNAWKSEFYIFIWVIVMSYYQVGHIKKFCEVSNHFQS